MMGSGTSDAAADAASTPAGAGEERKKLPDAARRALEEAAARRAAADAAELGMAKEVGGRGGREPVRYGDWEIRGKAVDF